MLLSDPLNIHRQQIKVTWTKEKVNIKKKKYVQYEYTLSITGKQPRFIAPFETGH